MNGKSFLRFGNYISELIQVQFIHRKLSMMSWSIQTLFCFSRSIPFFCSKKGVDQLKQKKMGINQDIIDGLHCIFWEGHKILKQSNFILRLLSKFKRVVRFFQSLWLKTKQNFFVCGSLRIQNADWATVNKKAPWNINHNFFRPGGTSLPICIKSTTFYFKSMDILY